MDSRERVLAAINLAEPDRMPTANILAMSEAVKTIGKGNL
jgi:hypothetical protein